MPVAQSSKERKRTERRKNGTYQRAYLSLTCVLRIVVTLGAGATYHFLSSQQVGIIPLQDLLHRPLSYDLWTVGRTLAMMTAIYIVASLLQFEFFLRSKFKPTISYRAYLEGRNVDEVRQEVMAELAKDAEKEE